MREIGKLAIKSANHKIHQIEDKYVTLLFRHSLVPIPYSDPSTVTSAGTIALA